MTARAVDQVRKYKQVLGIKGEITEEKLKHHYRERAKNLHPDRSDDPKSTEKFVLLHEAYEFYNRLLTYDEVNQKANVFKSKKYPERYYKELWKVDQRVAARKNAARRAKMKYKHFERMGYFKRLDQIFFFIDLFRA